MLIDLTHRIQVSSIQKATSLRGRFASLLEDDKDTSLVNTDQSQVTNTYEVIYVDTGTKERKAKEVETLSEEEAIGKVIADPLVEILAGVEQR